MFLSKTRTLALATAASLISGSGSSALAQNALQLFGSTYVRASTSGASSSTPVIFNSATANLTCPSGSPIKAVLSSTADGTGNLLVDNYVNLTVTTTSSKAGPTNVCQGGTVDSGTNGPQNNCFNATYRSAASSLIGQDLTLYAATGGVPPIDVSSMLVAGAQQATIDLVDTGVLLTNAPVYLVTSCTQGGVTGPATVTGNPISSTNPPPSQLSQDFTFNSAAGQGVGFTYDLTTSQQNGQLQITNSTIPNTNDLPLDPAIWQSQYATKTSFATTSCLVHNGELFNGQPACKLYTLTCQVGTGATSAGALCPVSQLRDEVFQDQFTGPTFTLPDITGPTGKVYHQGIGLLMASEGWTGGPCVFDTASGLQSEDCPQNLLTFVAPGGTTTAAAITTHASVKTSSFQTSSVAPRAVHAMLLSVSTSSFSVSGTGTHPNSTFISVAGVPEDLTTVTVQGQHPGGWVNSQTVKVGLTSEPPVLPASVPNYQNFVASPILSITYGISPAGTALSTKFALPGDVVLTNANGCPTPANPGQPLATVFSPPSQVVTVPADGQYQLHYFAQDCAGTEELQFSAAGNGGWATSFFTVPINVDTVAPAVASAPVLSPAAGTVSGIANAYSLNEVVTATYSCTDNAAGVAQCGGTTYSAPGMLNTGPLTSVVDTSTPGTKSFTVQVVDAAGNVGTPMTVNYTVVASPADLALFQFGGEQAKTGQQLQYDLLALNLGPNTAEDVVIRDVLPAGVTFVSAGYEDIACLLFGGCLAPPQATSCMVQGNVVTCKAGELKTFSRRSLSGVAVRIVVKVTAPPRTTLLNSASVSSSNPDPNPANNVALERTRIHD